MPTKKTKPKTLQQQQSVNTFGSNDINSNPVYNPEYTALLDIKEDIGKLKEEISNIKPIVDQMSKLVAFYKVFAWIIGVCIGVQTLFPKFFPTLFNFLGRFT